MAVTSAEEIRPTLLPPYPAEPRNPAYGRHKCIQVENTLFKIWDGSFRRHSEFFKSAPASLLDMGKGDEGSDDEHPLVLDGVQVADFERLLWIVYPAAIGSFKAKTAQDWTSVLDLATRWQFKDIRELSIKELGKFEIDPIEKIELQQKYQVKRQWAWSAFNALCSRPNGLDVVEGRRLGVETIINISAVREKLEKWGRKKPEEVRKAVAEIFELDLEGPPIASPPK
ncbi:hypothetical protein H0H92_007712 [Tricholoma furcatifolium]|nr:hypothetical protein H0H92_007712 [Tricholoma furcatifolium]